MGNEPFAVILPDDLVQAEVGCLKQMVDAYDRSGGNIVAVMDVPRAHTSRYGILDPGVEDGQLVQVRGLVEKPAPEVAPSTLSVIGRYILQPEVFEELERREIGAGNEIQLTDAMARLIGRQPFMDIVLRVSDMIAATSSGFFKPISHMRWPAMICGTG